MHRNIRQSQTPFSSGETQSHETLHFGLHDHQTPQRSIYTSQINESQIIHVNILITLCQWGERKGI